MATALLPPQSVRFVPQQTLCLDAFNNLLFFAAWPMLAACIALYLLRDMDTRWTIDDRGKSAASPG